MLISISPPMVVLVPATLTAAEVDTLLPPFVAVFPVNVILGVVPFNSKLAPADKNAAAAVACRVVRETGGGHSGRQRLNDGSAATRRSQAAWLFEKVEVPIVADAGTDAAGCRESKDQ